MKYRSDVVCKQRSNICTNYGRRQRNQDMTQTRKKIREKMKGFLRRNMEIQWLYSTYYTHRLHMEVFSVGVWN